MPKSPLSRLVIRTAVVARPDLGFIFACDLKKEKAHIPHAITFRWMAGVFDKGECNYDAHTACVIEHPSPGVVDASEKGFYTANTRDGMTTGNLIDDSQPPPDEPRPGGIRSVSEIAGKAHAVGIRGVAYRLDDIKRWKRIDKGLSDHFDGQAIHGFKASDIYAVGRNGQLWQYNGKDWINRDLPTNRNLTAVKCAGDGTVYIGGYGGTLIRGRDDTWKLIDHEATSDDVWDLEWFEGQLYVSTMEEVYRLNGDSLEPVDFGDDPPKSTYQLSAAKGVLWSNGEFDVMSFDGTRWTRVV